MEANQETPVGRAALPLAVVLVHLLLVVVVGAVVDAMGLEPAQISIGYTSEALLFAVAGGVWPVLVTSTCATVAVWSGSPITARRAGWLAGLAAGIWALVCLVVGLSLVLGGESEAERGFGVGVLVVTLALLVPVVLGRLWSHRRAVAWQPS